MPQLKYNAAVRAKVPDDSIVAHLCDGDHPFYEKHARSLERWFNDLNGSKRLWEHLTSGNPTHFSGARWHLTVAALFEALDFEIDFHHKLGVKTPDLGVSKDGIDATVEIFHIGAQKETVLQRRWCDDFGQRVQDALPLTDGFLSISLFGVLTDYASDAYVTEVVGVLKPWLDQGAPPDPSIRHASIRFQAHLETWDDPPLVSVTSGSGTLDPNGTYAKRLSDEVTDKLNIYGPVATRPIVLVVCTDEFEATRYGLDTVLLGGEQVVFDLDDPTKNFSRFSGEGLLVVGSPMAHEHAAKVAGVMYARRELFNEDTGAWTLDVSYMHNPYAEVRLPDDIFKILPERQVRGNSLEWVRAGHRTVL